MSKLYWTILALVTAGLLSACAEEVNEGSVYTERDTEVNETVVEERTERVEGELEIEREGLDTEVAEGEVEIEED